MDSALPYLEATCAFLILYYFLETWLDLRQRGVLLERRLPPGTELLAADKQLQAKEGLESSTAYALEKNTFSLIHNAFDVLHQVVLLWYGAYPWVWGVAQSILSAWALTEWQLVHIYGFVWILYIYSTIVDMPFSLYSIFVIEERHGFNKQTLSLFFMDHLKSLGVTAAIGLPIIAVVNMVLNWAGELFYLYLFLVMASFSLLGMVIYPTLIMPLFNKFTELEGDLKESIVSLAQRVGFPLSGVYQMDGSKRSGKANAFFAGFWKWRRIVLFDTLLEQLKERRQILAVLGHELGHWKKGHVMKLLTIALLSLLLECFVLKYFISSKPLFESFGWGDVSSPFIGLALFSEICAPIQSVISLAMNFASRRFEYQADAFAVEMGYDCLTDALLALAAENKEPLRFDPLYSMFHHSHPTVMERVYAILDRKKKMGKKEE